MADLEIQNLHVNVEDNEILKVTSPFDHDVTLGNLCIKGRFAWRYVQERPETDPPAPGRAPAPDR